MSASAPSAPQAGAGGRRRAQLVGGGTPAPSTARRLSLADVQDLRDNRSPEARAAFAARFGRQYDGLSEDEAKPLADAVLELLVRDVESNVRQSLAETVATSPSLPAAIAARLARDDIAVARPILEQSPVLSDQELSEIVRTHAMQYALAVAGREHLSESMSDVLAETGHAEVAARLVGNAGAQLSARTLRRIADDHRSDGRVQDPLIRRPALPYELVDQLVGVIGERLQWELVRERRMTAEQAQSLVAATCDRATLRIVTRDHGDHSLERELRDLQSAGELGPDQVLGYLRDGAIGRVEAALGLLADIDLAKVRQLLYGMDKRGLSALCARAGFATVQYATLRMALDLAEQGVKGDAAEVTYASKTLRFVQEQFEQISADPDAVAMWFAT